MFVKSTIARGIVAIGSIGFPAGAWADGPPRDSNETDHGAAQLPSASDVDRRQWRLGNEQDALSRAQSLLHPDMIAGDRVTTEVTVLRDDSTPFLHQMLVGRELWHVVIKDWALQPLKSSPVERKDSYVRTLDIYLDPLTAQVVKLESRWPSNELPIAPQPSGESATAQMRDQGEVYHGFPDEPPSISFLEAIKAIQEHGGNPLVAKQISGQWVLWSLMHADPKPMWVITLRGIPPVRGRKDLHPDEVNHLRYVVDPIKGYWIYASTTPQPEKFDPLPESIERKPESHE